MDELDEIRKQLQIIGIIINYKKQIIGPKTALKGLQTTTVWPKNVKIENAVETKTPTSWMPLR